MNQRIKNASGLTVEFLENGAIKSIDAGPIRISLKAGSIYSGSGTNIYLRKRTNPIEFHPLLGPGGESQFSLHENQFITKGAFQEIEYACSLQLAAKSHSWQWSIELINKSGQEIELDLVYMQDVGLKPPNAGLINEYYVAQYLDRRLLTDDTYGAVASCRQNMKEASGHPWLMLACKNGAIAGSTDGMQFYGKSYRAKGIPEGLLTDRAGGEYAGESSVITLQEKPFRLLPGARHLSRFLGVYLPDHPQAAAQDDLKLIPLLFKEFEAKFSYPEMASQGAPVKPLNLPSLLPCDDLTGWELDAISREERSHAEIVNGKLMSFFTNQGNHVVLHQKELLTDRPHAHIIQAKAGLTPDESIMSTTAFMFGVFNSHITQGNTNFNTLLSVCTSQFNQSPYTGQRIFVEIEGIRYLLGVPSAFEMGLNHCRWIYKHGDYIFQVRTWTSQMAPQVNLDFKVISKMMRGRGDEVRVWVSHDFDPLNKWSVVPGENSKEFIVVPAADSMINSKFPGAQFRISILEEQDFKAGGDEMLFPDRQNHGSSLWVLEFEKTDAFCMSFTGEVTDKTETVKIDDPDLQFQTDGRVALTEWKDLSLDLELESEQDDISAIRAILPWYGMDALIHYLTPYGLEQFGGAAWGTRDVSQGPVDLLLTLQKYEEAREVLLKIFSNQNPDGGWPQWWMFDSYREIRAHEAHGDIFYWCLIALANYIKISGDTDILGESLPYYHEKGEVFAEKTPLAEHVDRLLNMITDSFIPGTALVPYGGGDWNDSLQPVSPELAKRMISSWTVEMNYQAFSQFVAVFEMTGQSEKAKKLKEVCEQIRSDFNKHLMKDGVVAGYGLREDNGEFSLMLHPSDTKTGVHYSILPMERGILSGLFTKEQAEHHQELIEKYLKGPDGARLMDRPLRYRGGIQKIFQRAESSSFFGREIGLMYVHEHIRYAESLAVTGKADAFVKALRQAIPVAYRDVVPQGDIRQANCYYSSSDVHFKNRYEADERYEEVTCGNVTLRGGWRVYSSGPGIFIGIVITRLLGIRIESGNVILDPVLPFSIDGLEVSMDFMDYPVRFRYSVKEDNFSPKAITINGKDVHFTYEENPYRKGGAVIKWDLFAEWLNDKENLITVSL